MVGRYVFATSHRVISHHFSEALPCIAIIERDSSVQDCAVCLAATATAGATSTGEGPGVVEHQHNRRGAAIGAASGGSGRAAARRTED